jgi:hypothetical protein
MASLTGRSKRSPTLPAQLSDNIARRRAVQCPRGFFSRYSTRSPGTQLPDNGRPIAGQIAFVIFRGSDEWRADMPRLRTE